MTENRVQTYLEAITSLAPAMPTSEALVLKYGKPFTGLAGLLPKGMTRGQMGRCFDNCAIRALRSGLTYCEGFAIPKDVPIMPIYHGWLIDENGTIIDPTWQGGIDYYGIEFDLAFVIAFMQETEYCGILGNRFRLPGAVENYLQKRDAKA